MAVTSHQSVTRTTDGLYGPSVADFWYLLKPRVMSLVIFTGFAGMFLAPTSIHPMLFIISLFAIAAGAGASGAINRGMTAILTLLCSARRTARYQLVRLNLPRR